MVAAFQLSLFQVSTYIVPMALVRCIPQFEYQCIDRAIGCAPNISLLRVIFSFSTRCASPRRTCSGSSVFDIVVLNGRHPENAYFMSSRPLGDSHFLYRDLSPITLSPSGALSRTFPPESIHANPSIHSYPRKPECEYQDPP